MRRLNDGTFIRVAPVADYTKGNSRQPVQLGDWVFISISSLSGAPIFTGQMHLWEALVEIPYELDRAREFDREMSQSSQVKNEDTA